MRGLNEVTLLGNLTRDPEVKTTSKQGKTLAIMTVATNRSVKMPNGDYKDEADFHRVIAWGKTAENCGRFLQKGSQLLVQGRLSHREYKDSQEQKRYISEIMAYNVIFLGKSGAKQDFPDEIAEDVGEMEGNDGYDEDIPF